MSVTLIVVIVYALFCGIGGFIGFKKANSKASLIAGSVSELLLFLCAAGIYAGYRFALIATILIAAALAGRFVKTYQEKQRVMPDLMMVILSAIVILVVLKDMMQS